MARYGIRIRRPWWEKGRFVRGKQFRRANTPSGWTYWRNEWPNEAAAELRLNAYRALGWRGHVFEINELELVGRDEWGARPPKHSPTYDNWTDAPLVWHHTADAISMNADRGDNIDHMRSMQYFHQFVRDWNDVAYNWIIFPNGDVFVGRGFEVRGAGAADPPREWNAGYIHVAFAGDYRSKQPTPAAVQASNQLVAYLRNRGARIPRQYGHGDLMATSCPGTGVRQVKNL
jgi:hypothetical protein